MLIARLLDHDGAARREASGTLGSVHPKTCEEPTLIARLLDHDGTARREASGTLESTTPGKEKNQSRERTNYPT